MMGNRAIYKDGWLAATRHGIPWMTAGQATGFDSDVWELYDLDTDFTEADDLAVTTAGQAEGASGRLR